MKNAEPSEGLLSSLMPPKMKRQHAASLILISRKTPPSASDFSGCKVWPFLPRRLYTKTESLLVHTAQHRLSCEILSSENHILCFSPPLSLRNAQIFRLFTARNHNRGFGIICVVISVSNWGVSLKLCKTKHCFMMPVKPHVLHYLNHLLTAIIMKPFDASK